MATGQGDARHQDALAKDESTHEQLPLPPAQLTPENGKAGVGGKSIFGFFSPQTGQPAHLNASTHEAFNHSDDSYFKKYIPPRLMLSFD